MTVRYPIATSADQALNAPLGRAAREREARSVAASGFAEAEVRFVTEEAGPAFSTREAAISAYRGRLDPDRSGSVGAEDRFCDLKQVLAPVKGRKPYLPPVKPVFENGRRWPEPTGHVATLWRVSVSYWKVVEPGAEPAVDQARAARRDPEAQRLDIGALKAMARQPLKPVKPQQPLDIGLFETRAPENPDLVLPDE